MQSFRTGHKRRVSSNFFGVPISMVSPFREIFLITWPARLLKISAQAWRRRFVSVSGVVMAVLVYVYINSSPTYFYENQPWLETAEQGITKSEKERLLELTKKVLQTLEQMNVPYWLFYGSLWEIRRIPCFFMSGGYVDIGIIRNDSFMKKPEKFLSRFKAAGFIVSGNYGRWLSKSSLKLGTSKIKRLSVNLYAFDKRHGVFHRSGLETWLFFSNYKNYHSFPTYFVEPPLPKIHFDQLNISVPRGGLEVLRYIYPFHWNKELRLHHC